MSSRSDWLNKLEAIRKEPQVLQGLEDSSVASAIVQSYIEQTQPVIAELLDTIDSLTERLNKAQQENTDIRKERDDLQKKLKDLERERANLMMNLKEMRARAFGSSKNESNAGSCGTGADVGAGAGAGGKEGDSDTQGNGNGSVSNDSDSDADAEDGTGGSESFDAEDSAGASSGSKAGAGKGKGINSSDPNREQDRSKKEKESRKKKKRHGTKCNFKERNEDWYVLPDGTETDDESKAKSLLNTIVTGEDGKRYKCVGYTDSSEKTEITIIKIRKRWKKPLLQELDENDNPIPDQTNTVPSHPETDFLAKTQMSIATFAYIVVIWMMLKCPIYRISQYLQGYDMDVSGKQIYSYTRKVGYLLMPIIEMFKMSIGSAENIFIDETYWATREKKRLKDIQDEGSPSAPSGGGSPPKGADKKNNAKGMRTYMYGIVTGKAALYVHSENRDQLLPLRVLCECRKLAGLDWENFRLPALMTDGFYRFQKYGDKDGICEVDLGNGESIRFVHCLCWVHAKRYFVIVLNYATDKKGNVTKEFLGQHWEDDVELAHKICDLISRIFQAYNEIHDPWADTDNDVVNIDMDELAEKLRNEKNQKLKPLVDEYFKVIEEAYNKKKPQSKDDDWKCSKKLASALTYSMNAKNGLRAGTEVDNGVLDNNACESKFRDLDILRNSMMANDTFEGADTLAVYYSIYQTCKIANLDLNYYMKEALRMLMKNYRYIDLKKDERGSIIGYNGHSIPKDILEELMPWKMAEKLSMGSDSQQG